MAIRIPNLGTGNGQTGDNEFKIRSDYNNNFSDHRNAASRLIGDADGNVPEVSGSRGLNGAGIGGTSPIIIAHDDTTVKTGVYRTVGNEGIDPSKPFSSWSTIFRCWQYGSIFTDFSFLSGKFAPRVAVQNVELSSDGSIGRTDWVEIYTTGNTTTDGNGYIKPSSPVLRVFNDRIEGNDDANAMGAIYTKNGVGDYTITGTTGLRTDGWYITVPNDINGNPHVAVTLDDTDGVITLKTYVRIFDMTTFKFVPDLNQPLDIPDGRWIDLRFNDLPDDEPLSDEV